MSKDIKKEISDVIVGLTDGINEERRQNYLNNFAETLKDLTFDKLSNWELFQYETSTPLEEHIKAWYTVKYPNIDLLALDRIVFFYMNYKFLEQNVEKLVDLSRGCCCDKSSFILKTYLNKLIGNDIQEFKNRNDKNHQYWEPDFGTVEQWMEYLEGLFNFYYGNPDKYFKSYNELALLKISTQQDMEADEKLASSFVKTYKEVLERNKDKIEEVVYETMKESYRYNLVIFQLLDKIKNNTITDEDIINKVNELYNKYK